MKISLTDAKEFPTA